MGLEKSVTQVGKGADVVVGGKRVGVGVGVCVGEEVWVGSGVLVSVGSSRGRSTSMQAEVKISRVVKRMNSLRVLGISLF